MSNSNYKIHIVGAGISGLIAATVFEQNGYSPVIIEATDCIGGRVKTDIVKGYQLDRGFQVLLTAYPAVQKYLDTAALDLQQFKPGATIFKNGKQVTLGDPLRDTSLLFPTLLSGIGTLSDKIKILKLNRALKRKTVSEIFETKEKTTLSYLMDLGFSFKMIDDFFKPFFSGIFLEPNLNTSSRMFEFIYKMLGEGYAALPKAGIGAIPKQLANKLSNTTFQFNTKVKAIRDGEIQLSNGETLQSDYTLVATEASNLIRNLKGQSTQWKSCDTLYFNTPKRVIDKPLIGLIADSESLINNIFFHTGLQMAHQSEKELLSVTIVKEHDLTEEALILSVQRELKEYCDIASFTFIKRYTIPMALPDLKNVQYEIVPSETQLTSYIFLAGDTQLNGSLNAAMLSGERAALGVLNAINSSRII
ncbi:NAD(P)/FAD-dependent oxidoreductase [Croceitalea rosinachiae]|uniref:NAD(P)/FAD-dependent oxidoreductase n=1 Tax=Croceitalea rosinachiae TaxID=3075596 RepID=A0ABU3A824_9FLAO|nr:NAD(P)/FAD-dependent oxidoreductase [Croceitalea sp. F388]MDT0606321.1 NAD(P)/FAD-dependent oxidoreductase [Croceitalea sp. F388]